MLPAGWPDPQSLIDDTVDHDDRYRRGSGGYHSDLRCLRVRRSTDSPPMPESSRSRLAGSGIAESTETWTSTGCGEAAEAGAERVVAELADERHQRQRPERAGGGAVELAEQQLDLVGPDGVHLEADLA